MFNEKMDPLKVGTSAGLGVPILSIQEMPALEYPEFRREFTDLPKFDLTSAPDPLLLRILALEVRVTALETQTLGAYWARFLAWLLRWRPW